MKFNKEKEEEPRLSMTPLIDVVFLLLIFFMLTSHFQIASGVSIQLPKVIQKSFNTEQNKIVVLIDKAGRIYHKGKEIDEKTFGKELKRLVENEELVQMVLEADKEAKHGRVVQVMDLAKSAGVNSLVIAAQWKPEKVH